MISYYSNMLLTQRQECKLWEEEKNEKSVVIPHAKWKYFSVYVMILFIPPLIEYSGLSNLSLRKLASLSHVCSIWYLRRFSLKTLSMSSLAFQSEFAIVSFYDHFFICQDTHGESHFIHCLNYLSQTMGRKKDCLLFVADVKDSRAVWREVSRKHVLFPGVECSGCVRSVQTHLWIALRVSRE